MPGIGDRFGGLLLQHRNKAKFTLPQLAAAADIDEERLAALEAGQTVPDLSTLERLAAALRVNLRDLLPIERDTERGIVYCSRKAFEDSCRLLQRGGKDYYTYRDIAGTRLMPHTQGVVLDALCSDEADVVQNKGHFQHGLTYILRGPLKGYWDKRGQRVSRVLETGDSYFARGYLPHTYRSLPPAPVARFLSFTFAGRLAGDAGLELASLGEHRLPAMIAPGAAEDKGVAYGVLLRRRRLDAAYGIADLASLSGLPEETVAALEAGRRPPTWEEVERLAAALCVNLRDLLPVLSDTDAGMRVLTMAEAQRTERLVGPPGRPFYRIRDMARTTEMPDMRGTVMRPLRPEGEGEEGADLYPSLHTHYFVTSGHCVFAWSFEGERHRLELGPEESVYIEPYLPRAFYRHPRGAPAEVLSFAYAGPLAGEGLQELDLFALEGGKRIVRETLQWG